MTRTAAIAGLVGWITVTIIHACFARAVAAEPGWRTYASSGTRVEYPANILSASEGPFQIAPGERFGSADGRAHLAVFTMKAEKSRSPAEFIARNLQVPRSALHYERVAPGFFAISGFHDADIYYVRCNSASDGTLLRCIYLIYPAAEKRAWDPIVTRISRTLRPLM